MLQKCMRNVRPLFSKCFIGPKSVQESNVHGFKKFGHGQEFTPIPTTLWHGFLTITFISLFIDWKWVAKKLHLTKGESQDEIPRPDFKVFE